MRCWPVTNHSDEACMLGREGEAMGGGVPEPQGHLMWKRRQGQDREALETLLRVSRPGGKTPTHLHPHLNPGGKTHTHLHPHLIPRNAAHRGAGTQGAAEGESLRVHPGSDQEHR